MVSIHMTGTIGVLEGRTRPRKTPEACGTQIAALEGGGHHLVHEEEATYAIACTPRSL